MMNNEKNKSRQIAFTGLFAALVFVCTYFVKMPIPAGAGYIHFGDSMIYLGAVVLGNPYALFAGAIGACIADLVGGYASYAVFTFFIKMAIAVPVIISAKKNSSKFFTWQNALMTIPSGILTVVLYFIADYIVARNYAFVDIPLSAVQGVGSSVIFIIIAIALDTAKVKNRIDKFL